MGCDAREQSIGSGLSGKKKVEISKKLFCVQNPILSRLFKFIHLESPIQPVNCL